VRPPCLSLIYFYVPHLSHRTPSRRILTKMNLKRTKKRKSSARALLASSTNHPLPAVPAALLATVAVLLASTTRAAPLVAIPGAPVAQRHGHRPQRTTTTMILTKAQTTTMTTKSMSHHSQAPEAAARRRVVGPDLPLHLRQQRNLCARLALLPR